MHQAGLSGLPRRIPDMPDCYFELIQMTNVGLVIVIFALLITTVYVSSYASSPVATTMYEPIHYTIKISGNSLLSPYPR
jgi:heme/copper-type cytochrome/quinol oxidase subunit 1